MKQNALVKNAFSFGKEKIIKIKLNNKIWKLMEILLNKNQESRTLVEHYFKSKLWHAKNIFISILCKNFSEIDIRILFFGTC